MKITLHQWIGFNMTWIKGGKLRDQYRFGQLFCNEFGITDSELFYEEDHNTSVHMALVKYVDTEEIGANVLQKDHAKVINDGSTDQQPKTDT